MTDHPTILLWAQMSDPDTTVREKAIRADQRRLDMRELQAAARDLAWLLERVVPDQPREGSTVVVSLDALDQIRRTTRKLITLAERRAAAA